LALTLKIKKTETALEALRRSEIQQVKEYYRTINIDKTDRLNRTLLMNAIIYGELELAKWAIKHHANINHQDTTGLSALHVAVEKNEFDFVSLMLHSGVRVDLQDRFGNTALWRAMMDNVDINIINLLIQYHADPDLKNNYGISARDLLNEENHNWPILINIFNQKNPAYH